jgi:hypothetical protein
MDVLDKIGYVILQDPLVTASDIAKTLGYAEEKTVYYWLAKAEYHGLLDFKRAVVSGEYVVPSAVAQEAQARYNRIPIVDGFEPDGSANLTSETLSGSLTANVTGKFAWRYHGPEQGPVQSGDLLLLAKLEERDHVKWVLAGAPRHSQVVMRVASADATVFINTITWEPTIVPSELYRIVSIVRTMF